MRRRLVDGEDLLIIFRSSDDARNHLPEILRAEEASGKTARKLLVTGESQKLRRAARTEFERVLAVVKFGPNPRSQTDPLGGSVVRLKHVIHGRPEEVASHPHEFV